MHRNEYRVFNGINAILTNVCEMLCYGGCVGVNPEFMYLLGKYGTYTHKNNYNR